jgi:predicted enzyme related to lactoylglutathione lyase
MAVRPSGIVFDADDVPALAEFWHQATEYEVKTSGEWFAHLVPQGIGLRHIFVFKVAEGKTAKNRCHIDFETDAREAEVERLVSAGAVKVEDHAWEGFNWTVMRDPEGNEFCVASQSGE